MTSSVSLSAPLNLNLPLVDSIKKLSEKLLVLHILFRLSFLFQVSLVLPEVKRELHSEESLSVEHLNSLLGTFLVGHANKALLLGSHDLLGFGVDNFLITEFDVDNLASFRELLVNFLNSNVVS
jgi:hypothetical protein